MAFRCRSMYHLFWITLLWRFCKIKAYIDVCESPLGTMYCDCEELTYGQSSSLYRVTCVILQNISQHDPIWRSIGDADSISNLKLHPRLGNSGNSITLKYIPSDDLRRIANLKILRVEQGTLGTLRSHSLSEFQNLVELELEGNEITSLEPNAISNMPKLKKLTLSDNLLQELLADTLNGLDALEILFLDRNNISRIETCAFCNLQDLKELELWGNQISDLTEYTFRGLRYVKRLDLYSNKIRILSDKVFHTMPQLIELDLRENMISHIASRAFFGLNKLQTLSLGKNKIKILPSDVFVPLLNVRSVDIYNNELEIIQREVIDGIKNSKDKFFSIGFKSNPLKCDCAWQWITSYLKANNSHRFIRELQDVKCNLDNQTEELIVEYLKIADCKISTIKPRTPVAIHNMVTKSTDSAPIELNIQKSNIKVEHSNKPLATAGIADDGTEAYLSDVEGKAGMDDSGTNTLNVHSNLLLYISFIILCFIRSQMRL